MVKGPWTTGTAQPTPKPQTPQPSQSPQQTVLGAESVRATGQGPFDAAYRQNLATYGGGQFQRPGGNLSFNPTSSQPFGQTPPTDLLSLALGGQAFGAAQPAATQSPTTPVRKPIWQGPDWQKWIQQLTNQGGLLRGY
jgi:hypothetical protein